MTKITMSEIRSKFPMYGDMTDDQLLSGIRRKYYPEIPMARFAQMVDYDTERERLQGEVADQTNTTLAGIGQAFANTGRGVGQMLGMVSRDDVKQSRQVDEALNRTTGGKVGNFVGNVAMLAPTAMIPGVNTYTGAATIGAASGMAQPSESSEETAKNTTMGGLLGPAGILLGRGLNAAWQGGKALVEPFTKAGQEAIAARTLQQFASNPQAAAQALKSAEVLVPGSRPTMAQASRDTGLAQLERTLGNNPETGARLADAMAAQRAARLQAVQHVAGTDEFYSGIKEGVRTFAGEDYARAMAQGMDAGMAAALKPQIKELMARPSIQQAVREAKALAAEKGVSLKNPGGSVEGLDWVKKGIDNLISKATSPGNAIGKERLASLVQTKQDLMSVIEQVAPAYKEANDAFAQMSKQVNAMDAARLLLDKMQPALGRYGASSREMKNEYARALEQATESVKKSTGMNLPLSAVMPQRDIKALNNVAKDMARAADAQDLGRAVGSNTAQNLAAQNLLRRTLGPAGLQQSWAESNALQAFLTPYTGVAKLAGSENAVLERLLRASLDPNDAATLLMLAQRQPSNVAPTALRYAPALLLGANAPK